MFESKGRRKTKFLNRGVYFAVIIANLKIEMNKNCLAAALILLSFASSFMRSEAQKTVNSCDPKLWNFVWDPERLDVLDKCKTVTGVIVEKNADPDGDEHMLLKLDAGQENLLKKKNYTKKDGNLVKKKKIYNYTNILTKINNTQ